MRLHFVEIVTLNVKQLAALIAFQVKMLLAVPVASTAYILIKEATLKREKLKREEQSEIALEEIKEAEETKKDAEETEKKEIAVSKDENNN